ncbi:ABC transporter ATP-binding protein [Ethanoligenens sp.]|uniref:ABC transporter ATP-binding protein n=1 Tax=Ethanoligenens sp. TaxID=2099655 RepID=UPI0039EC0064
MEKFYQLAGIRKSFITKKGLYEVLGGIDLQIHPREFVCIMGNSGCGKSTLIKIMEGIESFDQGTFFLNGEAFPKGKSSKEIQRKFGIVFQNDNLLEWQSTYKNVELPLRVFGMKKKEESDRRVMEMLTLVGLQDYKDCLPKELSGGMRQRASIARALVTDPDFLMLDQPFGALDAITRKTLNEELLKIWNKTHKTCVMITNNVNEALYLGGRVLVMSNSPARIIQTIDVPLSYAERIHDIGLNPVYLELRAQLSQIVRSIA